MKYSVIIPAYNEADQLPRTIPKLRTAFAEIGLEPEWIVTDNASTDATADVARTLGADVVHEPWRQISRARNVGAARATGDVLVFVDADTEVPAATLRQMRDGLESGRWCAGGATVAGDRPWRGFARVIVWFWCWLARTQRLAAGSFLFATREALDACGGFDESVYALEEVWFGRRLQRWGRRRGLEFRLIDEPPVVTSTRKDEMFGSFLLGLQFLVLLGFPWLARFRQCCWIWYRQPDGRAGKDEVKPKLQGTGMGRVRPRRA